MMAAWARIDGGAVVELIGFDPTGRFNPAMIWVDITNTTPAPLSGWSATESGGVWTFAAPPAPPPPSLAQQATAAMSAALVATSTGTPALSATYAVDPTTQDHIQAETISILLNNTFADGTATLAWPDTTGAVHSFASVAEFKAFAGAVSAYVAALFKVINGTLTTLPAAVATIP
jgi:hypothetical protein